MKFIKALLKQFCHGLTHITHQSISYSEEGEMTEINWEPDIAVANTKIALLSFKIEEIKKQLRGHVHLEHWTDPNQQCQCCKCSRMQIEELLYHTWFNLRQEKLFDIYIIYEWAKKIQDIAIEFGKKKGWQLPLR